MAHHTMVHDIVDDHKVRIQNIKKFYPYFKLMETSFTQYKEGRYNQLDMGYIVLAVLRFFIEENNFKERYVEYPAYAEFMGDILRRDFQMILDVGEEEELVSYIFDKIKNDGKPFHFSFFDPADHKTKTVRTRLIEAQISDETVCYRITADGISFYLETKEVQDESSINMDQLLLEKLIHSQNFRGAVEVVRRINNEVIRLQQKKEEVLHLLSFDVFEGVKAYEHFMETGMKWFGEEQKLFHKNSELIQKALEKASHSNDKYHKAMDEIYLLETELKRAVSRHSELLRACTHLQIQADELLSRAKVNTLRNTFDFKRFVQGAMEKDEPELLEHMIKPFLRPYVPKTFGFQSLEDLLTCKADAEERPEEIGDNKESRYIYEDEQEENRISENYLYILKELLECILRQEEFYLAEFHEKLEERFGKGIFRNGDYYSFMVHLCQKKEYVLRESMEEPDTFLENTMKEFLEREENRKYRDLSFLLNMKGMDEPVSLAGMFEISNIQFIRR